jgi:hypothetical protein
VGDGSVGIGNGPQILFSDSGAGADFAGGTIGFERSGSNSIGDLVFGVRTIAGSSTTPTTEVMRVTSDSHVEVATGGKLYLKSSTAPSPYMEENNQAWTVNTGSAERMRIDSTGNVTIGGNGNAYSSGSTTFTPTGDIANTSVSGVASSVNIGGIGGVSNGFQINTDVNNKHTYNFLNGPDIAVKIDNTGQVGIGTTDPQEKLDVLGSVGISNNGLATSKLRINATATSNYINTITHGDDGLEFDNNTAIRGYTWSINGSEKARIDSSGNLLVGTNVGTGPRLRAERSGIVAEFNRSSGTSSIVSFQYGGTDAGYITSSAGGTPSFTAASDERLKDNIVDHESELANVMSLRPTRWDWKDEAKGSGEGFIAQELEATAWSDLVAEGDNGFKQVSGLGTVETRLIKAMQEQQAMIEALKAEVEALKNA